MSNIIIVGSDFCPNCFTGKVERNDFHKFGLCSNKCGVLLGIPSFGEPEQKVSIIYTQVGDEPPEKMTWEHFLNLSRPARDSCLGFARV